MARGNQNQPKDVRDCTPKPTAAWTHVVQGALPAGTARKRRSASVQTGTSTAWVNRKAQSQARMWGDTECG